MKNGFLKIYDKLIVSIIISIFALFGCGTKKKMSDNEPKTDTIQTVKDIDNEPVIAMYGARPNQFK